MIFAEIFRGSLNELNQRLDKLKVEKWKFVSVSLHSKLVYPDTGEPHPQSDWLICVEK